MPKIMIRVVAVILCLALLVAWSPMRAEAVMAEAILLFGDDIIIAIVGCLIGLGIVANSTWYESTARDIYSDVQEEYTSNPDNVIFHNFMQGPDPSDPLGLAVMQSVAMGSLLLSADVAEWIKGWLFDNEVIREEAKLEYSAEGFIRETSTENVFADNFWSERPIQPLLSTGDSGVLLTCFSVSNYYGLTVIDGSVKIAKLSGLSPYTTSTFPMGMLVDGVGIAGTRTSNMAFSDSLFLNYEVAYSNYLNTGKTSFYLTADSLLVFGHGYSYTACHSFEHVGAIRSDGTHDEDTSIFFSDGLGTGKQTFGLYPGSAENIEHIPMDGVELGQVAGKDEDMATGYPSWTQGAIENNGTTYYPIGSAPSIDSMASMNQEQIWSGVSVPKAPVIDSSGYKAEITYILGATVDPLLAMASSPDGGYLTYQWYNGSMPIEGQVAPRFYPPVTEVGSATYSCQVGNFKEGLEIGSYTWTQPVKITVTEAPATGDDEDPGLVVLPDGWFSPILEFFEGLNTSEKNEALQGGQAGIDGVIDVIPDFSGEFVGALTDFSGVLGYEGTAAVLVVPPLTIPAVQNLVPEYQLIGEQRVDLEEYVAMVPEGLLLLIRSLLTLALIAYCPKEFYDTIEYIITLKGGKD